MRVAAAVVLLVLAGEARAQEPPATSAAPSLGARLGVTFDLPRLADRMRTAGASDSSVRAVLIETRTRGLPAAEAAGVMMNLTRAQETGQGIENPGAFVRDQLNQGLRGQDLAGAVRAAVAGRRLATIGNRPPTRGQPQGGAQ